MRISIRELKKLIKESFDAMGQAAAPASSDWFEMGPNGQIQPIRGQTPRMTAEQIMAAKEDGDPIYWSRRMGLAIAKKGGKLSNPDIADAVEKASVYTQGASFIDAAELLGQLGY